MEEYKKRLIHLHYCRGIGSKGMISILKSDPSLKNIYRFSDSTLKNLTQLPPELFSKFYYDLQHLNPDKIIATLTNHNIHPITIFDKTYPFRLKQIYNPPIVLYTMGNATLLNEPSLAIVGSRKGNGYARKVIEELLPSLLNKRMIITSGLAKGVDTIAHQVTIQFGGKTIGVLGNGFFHVYPQENKQLAENMKKEHLLISEYPPQVKPQKWHFPMRNRIINGLSVGTLIIQAEAVHLSL